MVKHGRNKKRRAGRYGKTKIKHKNNFKRNDPELFQKLAEKVPTLGKHWDPNKSISVNCASMGLMVGNPNVDMRDTSKKKYSRDSNGGATTTVIQLFDIPDSDPMGNRTKKIRAVSIDDQKYIARCISKYGEDYSRAFRDTKTNYMQYTETQLRKLAARYLLLSPEDRLVELPKNAVATNA